MDTLASSIGVACAAALALPLALPPPTSAGDARARVRRDRPEARPRGTAAPAVPRRRPAVPGSTQSLPLAPLARDRALGGRRRAGAAPRATYSRFSLVGVVWDDPDARTARPGPGPYPRRRHRRWSGWQDVETHNRDARGRPGHRRAHLRPGTRLHGPAVGRGRRTAWRCAYWPRRTPRRRPGRREPAAARRPAPRTRRPRRPSRPARGSELEAPNAGSLTAESAAASAGQRRPRPARRHRRSRTLTRQADGRRTACDDPCRRRRGAAAKPYIGPRPRIVTRTGWGADETLRERDFSYTKTVKAAFVHHTAAGNNYTLRAGPFGHPQHLPLPRQEQRLAGHRLQLPRRQVRKHLRGPGRRRGQAGAWAPTPSVSTRDSMGIAVLGTLQLAPSRRPPRCTAIARLTAWKLGLYGGEPARQDVPDVRRRQLVPKGQERPTATSSPDTGTASPPSARAAGSTRKLGTRPGPASARYQGR